MSATSQAIDAALECVNKVINNCLDVMRASGPMLLTTEDIYSGLYHHARNFGIRLLIHALISESKKGHNSDLSMSSVSVENVLSSGCIGLVSLFKHTLALDNADTILHTLIDRCITLLLNTTSYLSDTLWHQESTVSTVSDSGHNSDSYYHSIALVFLHIINTIYFPLLDYIWQFPLIFTNHIDQWISLWETITLCIYYKTQLYTLTNEPLLYTTLNKFCQLSIFVCNSYLGSYPNTLKICTLTIRLLLSWLGTCPDVEKGLISAYFGLISTNTVNLCMSMSSAATTANTTCSSNNKVILTYILEFWHESLQLPSNIHTTNNNTNNTTNNTNTNINISNSNMSQQYTNYSHLGGCGCLVPMIDVIHDYLRGQMSVYIDMLALPPPPPPPPTATNATSVTGHSSGGSEGMVYTSIVNTTGNKNKSHNSNSNNILVPMDDGDSGGGGGSNSGRVVKNDEIYVLIMKLIRYFIHPTPSLVTTSATPATNMNNNSNNSGKNSSSGVSDGTLPSASVGAGAGHAFDSPKVRIRHILHTSTTCVYCICMLRHIHINAPSYSYLYQHSILYTLAYIQLQCLVESGRLLHLIQWLIHGICGLFPTNHRNQLIVYLWDVYSYLGILYYTYIYTYYIYTIYI